MHGRGRETRWKRIAEGSLPLAIDGLQPTPIVSGQERVNPYGDALLSSPWCLEYSSGWLIVLELQEKN